MLNGTSMVSPPIPVRVKMVDELITTDSTSKYYLLVLLNVKNIVSGIQSVFSNKTFFGQIWIMENVQSLYWNILSNSSNENIKIETSKNSIFLNDLKQIGCNTFDMKILMTTTISDVTMTSSMTSPLLPIMEPDISISNLVQIEKTLH